MQKVLHGTLILILPSHYSIPTINFRQRHNSLKSLNYTQLIAIACPRPNRRRCRKIFHNIEAYLTEIPPNYAAVEIIYKITMKVCQGLDL